MPTRRIAARMLALAVTALMTLPSAMAADAQTQTYAVLSLIGDRMTVVWFHPSTASNLDRNERQDIPTKDVALDNTALLAVDDAVKRVQPQAATVLLASRDPNLYKLQDQALDGAGDNAATLSMLKGLLQQSKATRLILVTKYKAEAKLQARDGRLGAGWLAGLGFFVDQERVTADSDTGIEQVGFIAPYAYFAVSLIDASTMTTLRRSVVRESTVVSTARAKGALRPWDALTPQQKLDALEAAIRKGMEQTVPELLAGI